MREFAEPFRHGWRQAVEVRATLVDIQSPFQRIQVLDTVPFGRMLVLDDAAQTAETEEYVYHEMLVHVPLLAHPDPRRVLIIGGGDGGALRRVLEYPVTLARQVEIDGEVVRVSRELLPSISAGAYDDPRADAHHRRRRGAPARHGRSATTSCSSTAPIRSVRPWSCSAMRSIATRGGRWAAPGCWSRRAARRWSCSTS